MQSSMNHCQRARGFRSVAPVAFAVFDTGLMEAAAEVECGRSIAGQVGVVNV